MAELPTTRASLLIRIRDLQDGEAWQQFVQVYAPVVYSYARRRGLQDADAADLTQDTLRAVAAGAGRLRPPLAPASSQRRRQSARKLAVPCLVSCVLAAQHRSSTEKGGIDGLHADGLRARAAGPGL